MADVVIYGTTWSVASWDLRRLLKSMGIPFRYVDVDVDDEARKWVATLEREDRGSLLPIVRLNDGSMLLAATRREVARHFGVRLETGSFPPVPLGQDIRAGRHSRSNVNGGG